MKLSDEVKDPPASGQWIIKAFPACQMHLSAYYNHMRVSCVCFIYLFLCTQLLSGEHTKESKITLRG